MFIYLHTLFELKQTMNWNDFRIVTQVIGYGLSAYSHAQQSIGDSAVTISVFHQAKSSPHVVIIG